MHIQISNGSVSQRNGNQRSSLCFFVFGDCTWAIQDLIHIGVLLKDFYGAVSR